MRQVESLNVVMPIYNEEECIVEVLNSWFSVLDDLKVNYKILIVEGSTDNTRQKIIQNFSNKSKQFDIIEDDRQGHGPAVLKGYKSAIYQSDWVFQVDADNEMKAQYFPKLWNERDKYDVIFGTRKNRSQDFSRKMVSILSRFVVRSLFGRKILDVNVPYRLMKASILAQIINHIPDKTVAPNLLITAKLNKMNIRVLNVDIPFEARTTGQGISNSKLLKIAFNVMFQTIRFKFFSK